jgi:iron complex outermembrane receptor protein
MHRYLIISLLIACNFTYAQGLKDSIFTIEEVQVSSNFDFIKEEAGMKEIRIDSMILQNQVNANLSDLLGENTTIILKDYGRGALSTASFRGTAPSHTQVSWNGMNINSPMLGMVDFSLIPVFIIDQLTIQYGAASIASQSGGLGGMIEINNKADWTNRFGGKLYLDKGSFHTQNGFAQVDIGSPAFQSKTRIYANSSLNDYIFVNKNIIELDPESGKLYHPVQKNSNAAFKKSGFTQEFYLRDSSNWTLSNKSWIQNGNRSVPTMLSNEYAESDLQINNIQSDQTFKNVSEIVWYRPSGKLTARSGIDLQQLNYRMDSQIIGLGNNTNVDSKSRMFSWNTLINLEKKISEMFSAELKGSLYKQNISSYDDVSSLGYDTSRVVTSFFGGIYASLTNQLQFSTQIRKDIASDYQAPIIYAFGINYKPVDDKDLIVKGNFSRNYHHPGLNDLYWEPGGNPELLAEEGYTSEVSAIYIFTNHTFTINSSITGYISGINNWIMWLPGFKGYWEPVNIDRVNASGVEYYLSLNYYLGKTVFKLSGNIAYTKTVNINSSIDPENASSISQLPLIPIFSGNVFASVQRHGYYIHFQNSSMGKRNLLSSNADLSNTDQNEVIRSINADYFYTMYPHYLNKLSIGKSFSLKNSILSAELYIDNLFNETYRNVLQRFMPGRSYNIHMKFDF